MRIRWRAVALGCAVLAATAVAGAQDQEADRPLRVYDVSLLTQPVKDCPGPDLDPSDGTVLVEPDEVEACFDADDLVTLLTETVAPASWSEGGARCRVAGRTLEVVQTPAVHAQVAAFLGSLRPA